MTQIDELKAEMRELRSRIDGLCHENAKLHEELANFKVHATDAPTDESETNVPTKRSLFWAFLRGVGSVLEIYPQEGCFDRWRMQKVIPENDYALLFRELWESTHPKKPSDG